MYLRLMHLAPEMDTNLIPDPTRDASDPWPGLTRCFGGVQAYWPNLANYGLV